MPILIDGHNLIPHIPGLSLADIDDESRLIELVQVYCRIQRKQVDIYFDNAPPGYSHKQKVGMVKVKFSRQGQSADQDIKEFLLKLGKGASNWTVVTSDRSIQVAVRAAHARIIPSEEFARELIKTQLKASEKPGEPEEQRLGEEEVLQWLQIFKEGKKK